MMPNRFDNKIILVTGGNSGIGLAAARRLLAEGARVIITGRNRQTLDRAASELGKNAQAVAADISRLPEIDALYEQIKEIYGRLDGIFANAGFAPTVPIEKVTEADFDAVFDANVKGTFFTVQKAIALLSKGAAIVLNASVAGIKGTPQFGVYGATKAAVRCLARGLSAALVERGIRVNAVSPGPIETPIFDGMDAKMIEAFKEANPSKRFGRPEEIAAAVAYLLAEESAYVVGAELFVDGGMTQL